MKIEVVEEIGDLLPKYVLRKDGTLLAEKLSQTELAKRVFLIHRKLFWKAP